MNTLLITILLGISLSMDAFSLSVFLGTVFNKKNAVILVLFTGIFHFFMPILGAVVGYKVINIIYLNGEFIFSMILLFLAIQVFLSILKKEEFSKSFLPYEIVLLAFGVSIDSFTIGFGLSFNDNFMLVSSVVFSICSMIFTYVGLIVGKYSSKILGVYSKFIGGMLLLAFSLTHLLRI